MSSLPSRLKEAESVIAGFYLTIPEAAERLGLHGRTGEQRLRRLLNKRERALGKEIMIRLSGKVPRMLITIPLLEEHCPELFSRRIQLTEHLREEIERLEGEIALLRRQNLRIAEEVGKISSTKRTIR